MDGDHISSIDRAGANGRFNRLGLNQRTRTVYDRRLERSNPRVLSSTQDQGTVQCVQASQDHRSARHTGSAVKHAVHSHVACGNGGLRGVQQTSVCQCRSISRHSSVSRGRRGGDVRVEQRIACGELGRGERCVNRRTSGRDRRSTNDCRRRCDGRADGTRGIRVVKRELLINGDGTRGKRCVDCSFQVCLGGQHGVRVGWNGWVGKADRCRQIQRVQSCGVSSQQNYIRCVRSQIGCNTGSQLSGSSSGIGTTRVVVRTHGDRLTTGVVHINRVRARPAKDNGVTGTRLTNGVVTVTAVDAEVGVQLLVRVPILEPTRQRRSDGRRDRRRRQHARLDGGGKDQRHTRRAKSNQDVVVTGTAGQVEREVFAARHDGVAAADDARINYHGHAVVVRSTCVDEIRNLRGLAWSGIVVSARAALGIGGTNVLCERSFCHSSVEGDGATHGGRIDQADVIEAERIVLGDCTRQRIGCIDSATKHTGVDAIHACITYHGHVTACGAVPQRNFLQEVVCRIDVLQATGALDSDLEAVDTT